MTIKTKTILFLALASLTSNIFSAGGSEEDKLIARAIEESKKIAAQEAQLQLALQASLEVSSRYDDEIKRAIELSQKEEQNKANNTKEFFETLNDDLLTDNDHKRKLMAIVKKGINLSTKSQVIFESEDGKEIAELDALSAAIEFDYPELVKLLLEKGAKVNAFGQYSPLHRAAESGYLSSVEVLLKFNADVNALDDLGNSPLHLIFQKDHQEGCECSAITQKLLDLGADLKAVNYLDKTPVSLCNSPELLSIATEVNTKRQQDFRDAVAKEVGDRLKIAHPIATLIAGFAVDLNEL